MNAGNPVSRKIRVLHFIESGGVYGAERVILNLSREMAASGHYEPVIGCIVQHSEEKVDLTEVAASWQIESHRIVIANSRMWWDLPRAAQRVRELQIDLIHCHGYKPGVFAAVIGKLARVKTMATCHLWFIDDNAPLRMRAMISIEKFLYRHYPAVVAVSEKIRDILLAVGARSDRVHVIQNGIALSDYESGPGNASAGGVIRVLSVARLTQQKAQRDLVAAAALIRQTRRDIEFLIVGEGELRQALQQQIEAENLQDSVHLLGFRSDVRELLQQADVFALPSLDEGMPISLLEAVACKVPAIVTPVGDIPKLIVDGETGVVINMRDPAGLAKAILSLADDVALRRRFAENAWRRLRDLYSSTQMFQRYDAVYRMVLEGRSSATAGVASGLPTRDR
jgi:glycosyltransferase involved in cell wall biosynthesis